MFLTLLLQTIKTVTVTEGILPAVYGTLFAALLSLAASIYATITSSTTSKEVARLSRQAAEELKDKDYKHDFYKKIIERRLKAWEEAELTIAPLSSKRRDIRDNRRFPSCFNNLESLNDAMQKIIALTAPAFWLGAEVNTTLLNLHIRLRSIVNEGIETTDNGITNRFTDEKILWETGKKYNKEFSSLLEGVVKALGKQIVDLPNVEGFFEQLKHLGVGE